jgi:uncharacterized membrane protein
MEYSGPMPLAAEVARYEAIYPGSAQRMFVYADRQQIHRHGLEAAVVRSNIALASRGQWMGFMLGMLGILAATYLIATGRQVAGVAVFFGDILSLVGVFVYGRREARKQRERDAATDAG